MNKKAFKRKYKESRGRVSIFDLPFKMRRKLSKSSPEEYQRFFDKNYLNHRFVFYNFFKELNYEDVKYPKERFMGPDGKWHFNLELDNNSRFKYFVREYFKYLI